MKRFIQTLVLGGMLLAVPALAQDKVPTPPVNDKVTITTPAPVPVPTPTAKDPNHWKRPLQDIKFREF